jgi:hypothetical protein
MNPTPKKPRTIIAQVVASGTAVTSKFATSKAFEVDSNSSVEIVVRPGMEALEIVTMGPWPWLPVAGLMPKLAAV